MPDVSHTLGATTAALSENEHERLLAALKASRCGTWRWTVAGDVVEWDDALCEVYGVARADAPTTSRAFLALVHPDDRERAWAEIDRCLRTGADADYEFRAVVGDTVRWIYDRSAVVRHPDGTPAYMLGACLDVTERRRVEDERTAALEKQQLLLRELTHRVKNHFGMIVALLRLKGARHRDPAVRQDFERAIERVNTIAYLHDRLYRADKVESIDVGAYLGDICANLEGSLLPDTRIAIVREVEPFELPVDQAVPVGLIVNELVTNAVKYAFAPGQEGRIAVRLRRRGERATLAIADTGRGMAGDAEPGVGTRLVRSLAAQLGGRLRTTARKGLAYSLSFPIQPRRPDTP